MPTGVYERKPPAERFWEKVDKKGDCWEWTATKLQAGYGRFNCNGKLKLAHRVSWEIHNGPIPNDLCVLHQCDNPGCVNPEHLFLGTPKENTQDAVKKGRLVFPRGEDNGASKFTEKQVLAMRAEYEIMDKKDCAKLGRKYKTGHSAAWKIINRKTWKHI